MIINFNNNQLDIIVKDDSYRYRGIRKENALTLHFDSPEFIDIPVGAWTEFMGERYELMAPENFKKNGSRKYEYTLILESEQSKLKKYKFKDVTTKKLKFSLTDKPSMHIQFLVDNMNMRESGWSVGETIDAVEQVISYNHNNCFDALNMIANAFNTEWEVSGKKIHLRKVEYNKENPLSLSYGKGNGFKPGVGRINADDSNPVEILYTQGGSRNIDRSKYGNDELLLPKGQQLEYEGRKYIVDDEGYSMRRSDKELTTKVEDSLDCTHIYPSRIGTISEVIVIDSDSSENKFYDFKDSSIPDDLDYSTCQIKGEKATIIFQDGMLAGKEFDIETDQEGNLTGYIHSERRFKLVQQEIDGMIMPNTAFSPVIGGKYAVFGVSLPDPYIVDNSTQTGAEWEMFKEGAKYLYEHEDPRFTFTGELDGIWAKKNWDSIATKIVLGGYINFSDNHFQPDGVLIRIIGVKEFINDPYSPIIELSNVSIGATFSSEIKKIDSNEVLNEDRFNKTIKFTKRLWRDAEELYIYLQKSLLAFSKAINPISVQTMQMLVGDQNLQFRFVNSTTNPVEIDHPFRWDDENKLFTSSNSLIQHMTLGIDTLAPGHKPSEYKFWSIANFSYRIPDVEPRWVYLKCSKSLNNNLGNGEIVLSKTAISIEQVSGYYHFLVGFLNSEFDELRSFVPLYGFTEITPGQIRVNKIISPDGDQYWDMLNKRFMIGNANSYLSYNVHEPDQLRLKGTIFQSPSGDIDYPEVDRGNWTSYLDYYPGDKVKGSDGNIYKCIKANRSISPQNSTYWKLLVSKGDPGATGVPGTPGVEGQGYMYAYYPSDSITPPSRPTSAGGSIPYGWQETPNNYYKKRYVYQTQCIKSNGVWGQWSYPVLFNYTPPPGDSGPAMVFRGNWFDSKVHNSLMYNNAARRDVVVADWGGSVGKRYYIYKGTNNTFPSYPFDEDDWEYFGAQFSSVATDTLLTLNANVGGWIFNGERLESQSGGSYLNGKNGECKIIGSFESGVVGQNRVVINPQTTQVTCINQWNEIISFLGYASNPRIGAIQLKDKIDNTTAILTGKSLSLMVEGQGGTHAFSFSYARDTNKTNFYIDPNRFPKSKNEVFIGGWYIDNDTIKVRTS